MEKYKRYKLIGGAKKDSPLEIYKLPTDKTLKNIEAIGGILVPEITYPDHVVYSILKSDLPKIGIVNPADHLFKFNIMLYCHGRSESYYGESNLLYLAKQDISPIILKLIRTYWDLKLLGQKV